MKKYILPLLLLFVLTSVQAQLVQIPFEQKEKQSKLIVEAEVVELMSYRGYDGRIYTANTLKIYKNFKGHLDNENVTVITMGGRIDNKEESWTHVLSLKKGEKGVFFLKDTERPKPSNITSSYAVYSGLQGFLRYIRTSNRNLKAIEPFNQYPDINNLYSIIENSTNTEYQMIQRFDMVRENTNILPQGSNFLVDPVISSFSPEKVAAGVGELSSNDEPVPGKIIIKGDGFGTPGIDFPEEELGKEYRVEFTYGGNLTADDTWVAPHPAHYISWKNDEIEVLVPSFSEFYEDDTDFLGTETAGTGKIKVIAGMNASGELNEDESDEDLIVKYSVRSAVISIGGGEFKSFPSKILNFFDGGIGFYFSNTSSIDGLFPLGAKDAVEWAMSEWRCATGINISLYNEEGLTDEEKDLMVEIVWTNDLPAGAPSTTLALVDFSPASGCHFSGEFLYTKKTIKGLYIKADINWHFGENQPPLDGDELDLRSIMLHEFGHVHLLQHVNDATDLMYYGVQYSDASYHRYIDENPLNGGKHVSKISTEGPATQCGTPMLLISEEDCELDFSSPVVEVQNNRIKVYPTISHEYVILEFLTILNKNSEIAIFDALGKKVMSIPVSKEENMLKIDIENLNEGVYFISFLSTNLNNPTILSKFIKI